MATTTSCRTHWLRLTTCHME
ncbi:hypothetical protein CFP56_006235 [Quercus suber]|uniref:Uncharacterized protein n=1 Tax=Quercus suber TaxID=58331 RepID=A0AAW0L8C0_QUESU